MHIGLIGGIGPAATDHYYRGLIEGHAAALARAFANGYARKHNNRLGHAAGMDHALRPA